MFKTLLARARQGYRTAAFPPQEPVMPALFRGRPELSRETDSSALARCAELCPTGALSVSEAGPEIDLGRCIFCGDCVAAAPHRLHPGLAARLVTARWVGCQWRRPTQRRRAR